MLYYCPLPVTNKPLSNGVIERKKCRDALTSKDLDRITSHWNPKIMLQRINERFAANAELWLMRCNETIAAYGWTLKEKTIEPYFFPIKVGDIHLFDFYAFTEFRGRGLNPSLVWQILAEAGLEGSKRAFIEAAIWNNAQRSSLAKTPFIKLGTARKLSLWNSTLVLWRHSVD